MNEFEEFREARQRFLDELYKTLKLAEIVEWLQKRLSK